MNKRNINKLDLVLLAGGRGLRISKFTKLKPKPLIQFKDKHFLSYLVNHYSKYPFEKIFILAGYKGMQIFNKFNKKISNGIEIECLVEKQTLGTGGALAQLRLKLSNDLIVMNADSFIDCNLERFFLKKNKYNSIFLTKNENYLSNNTLANLKINKKSFIDFDGNLMNAGIYYLKKNTIKKIPKKNISLENTILHNLIRKKKLIKFDNITIDSKSGYSGAGKNYKKKFKYKNFGSATFAYSPMSHRHTAEMDQEFKKISKKIKFVFNPHLVPTFRGILSSIYIHKKKGITIYKIVDALKKFYSRDKFIKILKENTHLGTGNVLNTNNCEISVCNTRYENKLVIFSAIDNLVKGAAGQAVQNMNLMFKLKETLGLK